MYVPISLQPGINKEITPTQNANGYSDGDKVRFWNGFPEKIGGWQDASAGNRFAGICRGIHIWQALDGSTYMAVGTTTRLYIWRGGRFYDITPTRFSRIVSNPFSTTAGSSTVVVSDNQHGSVTGDTVIVSGATDVGGLSLSGEYSITYITDNSYSIEAAGVASATTTGGGNAVTLDYLLSIGPAGGQPNTGYGVGGYGVGTYGTARTGSARADTDPRTWSLDNWGEELIANPAGGKIYKWSPSTDTTSNRASRISGSPDFCNGIMVTAQSRQLVAFGAEFVTQDELMVRWSDREDYTTWIASDTNAAGSFRVSGGSRIMLGIAGRGEALILTDTSAISMRYVGVPLVFGFSPVGDHCGAISKKCAVELNGTIYWQGPDNFHAYNGRVATLPSTVRTYVFDNLNRGQRGKCFAGVVPEFQEVWFFYQAGAADIDNYAAVSTVDGSWHIGSLERTAWADGRALAKPIAASPDGAIFYHETGTTDDGTPFTGYVETGDFRLGEGDRYLFVDKVIPDFSALTDTGVDVYIKWRRYPSTTQSTKGPYTVTPTQEWFNTRVRSRQASLRYESLGPFRAGKPTVNVQPDGAR